MENSWSKGVRLQGLIKGLPVAMLTTIERDGSLHSRPMWAQELDDDATIWFLTAKDAAKVHEVSRESQVNVSYSSVDDERYVSISGTATLAFDPARAKRLVAQLDPAWLPEGLDESRLALLRVSVQKAHYWDAELQRMTSIGDFGAKPELRPH